MPTYVQQAPFGLTVNLSGQPVAQSSITDLRASLSIKLDSGHNRVTQCQHEMLVGLAGILALPVIILNLQVTQTTPAFLVLFIAETMLFWRVLSLWRYVTSETRSGDLKEAEAHLQLMTELTPEDAAEELVELEDMCEIDSTIKSYTQAVLASGRYPLRLEYRAAKLALLRMRRPAPYPITRERAVRAVAVMAGA